MDGSTPNSASISKLLTRSGRRLRLQSTGNGAEFATARSDAFKKRPVRRHRRVYAPSAQGVFRHGHAAPHLSRSDDPDGETRESTVPLPADACLFSTCVRTCYISPRLRIISSVALRHIAALSGTVTRSPIGERDLLLRPFQPSKHRVPQTAREHRFQPSARLSRAQRPSPGWECSESRELAQDFPFASCCAIS